METKPENTDAILKMLCVMFVSRSVTQDFKGKRRDALALEFFLGAVTGLQLSDHPEADRVRMFTVLLVATRGYSEIVKVAERAD